MARQATRPGAAASSPARSPPRRESAARDHLGDPARAHRDPVEHVGRVHGALLVGDDHELGTVREPPDELQEAVDVGVVERRLDLVEDVEGRRPGEEDGEHEGERDQRLLATGEQREPPRRLAGRGDLDLDALPRARLAACRSCPRFARPPRSAPASAASGSASGRHPGRRRLRPRRRAPGAGPASLTSRRRPRPPGKRCSISSSKFRCVASSVSSKADADLAVGVADQARQLGERRLEVRALLLELVDVLERLRVLLLGERVDRAERLAAAGQALELSLDLLALLGVERLRRRPRARDPAGSRSARAPPRASSRRSRRCAALTSASVTDSPRREQLRLQLGLVARAGAQLAR